MHAMLRAVDGILPKVWALGNVTDAHAAFLPAFDHGITVGDGVFETAKIVRGRPFALRRHLERLSRSAAGLGLPSPDVTEVRAAIDEVIGANALGETTGGVLRITYTAGPGPLGSGRPAELCPSLVVAAAGARPWGPTASVQIVPWTRNERGALAGLKTTSYGENVVALASAHRSGADEAIFANTRGELCEGTGTNVFVGIAGRLVTPPLSSGCLDGVTRALVVELGGIDEDVLPIDSLRTADEAFLTSSTREVHPIATVDGHRLAQTPGALTARAAAAFADLVARDLDP